MRRGDPTPVLAAPDAMYWNLALAPDGERIALGRFGDAANGGPANLDVSIWDSARATEERLTFSPARDAAPIWSPDGREIVHASTREGGCHNSTAGQPAATKLPCSVSRVGLSTSCRTTGAATAGTFCTLSSATSWHCPSMVTGRQFPSHRPHSPRRRRRFRPTDGGCHLPQTTRAALKSTSSRFPVASASQRSGRESRAMAATAESGAASGVPRAASSSFADLSGELMATTVHIDPRGVRADKARALFGPDIRMRPDTATRQFDVTLDAQRFLMISRSPDDDAPSEMTVVWNWQR
jgi:WD40-like Beta Propeller Repeat